MADVNLGDADAAIVIGIWVFDEVIGELYDVGVVPAEVDVDPADSGIDADVRVRLDRPRFRMDTPEGAPSRTLLDLTGSIEVRPLGQPGAEPVVVFDLEITVRLGFDLVPGGDDRAPVLVLRYEGVEGTPSEPVTVEQVDGFFQSEALTEVLARAELDIVQTLVEGLSEARGFGADRPGFHEWPVALVLQPGDADNDDAVACVVAPPGADPAPATPASWLAKLTGFSVTFARAFIDLVLAEGAADKVGDEEDGATITRLNVFMTDDAMFVQGAADGPLGVSVTWDGPARPQLLRGTTDIVVDASEIDVEKHGSVIDDILVFFGLGFLSTVFIPAVVPLVWKGRELWQAGQHIDAGGADAVQDSIASALGVELDAFATGLSQELPVGDDLTVEVTPDRLEIVDGSMVLLAQVFVRPLTEQLRRALYSKGLGRFALYETRSGRTFRARELARLVEAGKITVPGFHAVDGRFLRADPDARRTNNLGTRFGRTGPDEAVA